MRPSRPSGAIWSWGALLSFQGLRSSAGGGLTYPWLLTLTPFGAYSFDFRTPVLTLPPGLETVCRFIPTG